MNTLAQSSQQHPLNWIKPELEKTITKIRDLFESYSQDLDDESTVLKIQSELHLLYGSFEILDLHGAALLVDDMQQACSAMTSSSNSAHKEDIYEALLQATLTLESYVDKLNISDNGFPSVLLPVINDIRASLKQPLLSEGTLFSPNLSIVPKVPLDAPTPEEISQQLREYSSKLRPYYQAALLSWFRDPDDELSLQQLRLVARNFESICRTPRNKQIWWIVSGLFEAMLDKGLRPNISLRLILGHVDRVIKSLTQGEAHTFEKQPPVELLKNALFYIARSNSDGNKVNLLKQAYKLENAIPDAEQNSTSSANSGAPNSETFKLISKELLKSLEQIKATIENFVRNTPDNPIRLKQTLTPLKHITDTLSLLNLGVEKQRLQTQINFINEIIDANKAPSQDAMLEIAAAILDVENSLHDMGRSNRHNPKTIALSSAQSSASNIELIKIAEKTSLEAQGNIAQIKNLILAYIASNQTQKELAAEIPRLLTELKGCLIILNNQQASKITTALVEFVENEIIAKGERLPSSQLDILAETIVGLEYFFETIADPNVTTDAIIEMARTSVNKLGFSIPALLADTSTSGSEDVVNIRDLNTSSNPRKLKKAEQKFVFKQKSAKKDSNIVPLNPEQIDDEVANIFIEEAIEELENMRSDLRTLQLSMDDPTALSSVRRTFHTLKGSGRIAGAVHISELAMLLNDYLNRVMCGALKADKKILALLENSHKLMFELIEHFKQRKAPPDSYNQIVTTIKDIIGPIPEPHIIPKLSEVIPIRRHVVEEKSKAKLVSTHTQSTTDKPSTTDKVQLLLEVAIAQVATIDNFAAALKNGNKEKRSSDELLSAIQKLTQCALLSNAREFIHTTELLAKYINNAFEKDTELKSDAIDILVEFCATSREILFDLSHTLNDYDIEGDLSAISTEAEPSNRTNTQQEEIDKISETSSNEADESAAVNSSATSENSKANNVDTEKHQSPNSAATSSSEEYDPDLIDIFMEEAVELIESENNLIEEFENDDNSSKFFDATKRILHTMKGSARMAGLIYVGDLSHSLETKIESINANRSPKPDNMVEIIQSCFDSISDVIEDIRAGKPVVRNQQLLDKIDEDPSIVAADSRVVQLKKPVEKSDTKDKGDNAQRQTTEEKQTATNNASSLDIESTTKAENSADYVLTSQSVNTNSEAESSQKTAQQKAASNVHGNKESKKSDKRAGSIKIDASIVDLLVDQAGEESAINNRIEDHIATIKSNLFEMDKTITRALAQMRDLQFEAHNLMEQNAKVSDQFDMDTELNLSTFSEGQKITQRLMESFGDIESLHGLLTRLTLETDTFIHQQKKIHSELHTNLLNTRMVTFSVQTQRMQRILRQTCISLRKKAKLTLEGTEGSIDRSILETLMGPMEHIIRNAAAHGIEPPSQRRKVNKREAGNVHIKFSKDRSEHLIEISDDGAGINLKDVRKKAIKVGLIAAHDQLSDDELCNLIFKPGFTTCDEVSQISGRGVGMDVAMNEIRQLGGTLSVSSTSGEGAVFTIRLPFTVSSNHTLFVRVGKNTYALPSNMIEHSFAISREDLQTLYQSDSPSYRFGEQNYPLWNMESLLNNEPTCLPAKNVDAHIVLLHNGASTIALQVDDINESRDSIIKPASPQLSNIRGIAGATVLGDGKVVLIIDVPSLILYAEGRSNKPNEIVCADEDDDETIKALVVDDSITVRKVTERFLNRHNIEAFTAIDGIDALNTLENVTPDIMLVDIEMPNMDGLELTQRVRSMEKLKDIPIIMITSRTGKQHRETASEVGVSTFLPKPYQETELIKNIQELTGKQILTIH